MAVDCLIRFVQVHESFRLPELQALAELIGVKNDIKVLHYADNSPFGIVQFPSAEAARKVIDRSILVYDVYILWGTGHGYLELHESIRQNSSILWNVHQHQSFRFTIDSFQGKKSRQEQNELIESFKWFQFEGPIIMQDPELMLCIFEDYELDPHPSPDKPQAQPRRVHLGSWLQKSGRDAITTYNLKKRIYISRTSMDAELALVTANLSLAERGKIVYDPFVGTGSFIVACAHFGATTLGSDIDGRSIRGVEKGIDLYANFKQYKIEDVFLDSFIADLTHGPLRMTKRFLDVVICDPPYGVREGPKVLGYKDGKRGKLMTDDDGVLMHLREGFIAPKRPYGFDDLLQDVLDFSYESLVDGGRLAMWMPTANDEDIELAIPRHPGLELASVSVQQFNKWARRLLTYRRLPGDIYMEGLAQRRVPTAGVKADELNRFRKKYFEGFRPSNEAV